MKDIVLVDDHPLLRKRSSRTIEAEADLKVAGQDSAEEALGQIDELAPDLAVVDTSSRHERRGVQSRVPDVQIFVVSRHDETLYAERCIRTGARGYAVKQESGNNIMEAIRKVLNRRIFVGEEINERLLQSMAEGGGSASCNRPWRC